MRSTGNGETRSAPSVLLAIVRALGPDVSTEAQSAVGQVDEVED